MPDLFSVEGLSHSFADRSEGLSDVGFVVREGEFIVLAGRNGSGKTLLARHLVGLARPNRGTVSYKGIELKKSLARLRIEVGFVVQDVDAQILGQTVAEDVAFGPANLGLDPEEIRLRVAEALEKTCLSGKESRRPETLSGGEKRRLAIAGVLAMRPGCILLDEPFANLDYESVKDVDGILGALSESGITLIVITHELEKVLSRADRLLVLDSGNLVYNGSPEGLEPRFFPAHGLACPYREAYPWCYEPVGRHR